jgi:hypothetical protein
VIQDGLIVKGERQEDFDALRQEWLEEYVPKGALEERLLEDIVRYKWFLMRAERNVEKVAARMAEREPEEWSEADHKLLQLMMRYQAARERTFYRAWHAFEQLRKDRMGEAASIHRFRTALKKNPRQKPVQNPDASVPKNSARIANGAGRSNGSGKILEKRAQG